jgi:hypothetical protein
MKWRRFSSARMARSCFRREDPREQRGEETGEAQRDDERGIVEPLMIA